MPFTHIDFAFKAVVRQVQPPSGATPGPEAETKPQLPPQLAASEAALTSQPS